ncbi:hypothetical protein BaRGS_00013469 [Batillaria attramentaria]|uniref:Uncharacterized protein n=1 Tax=Batillaria attramentaria TaxID=370345 RepID=A0ABD0L736_9CAEN
MFVTVQYRVSRLLNVGPHLTFPRLRGALRSVYTTSPVIKRLLHHPHSHAAHRHYALRGLPRLKSENKTPDNTAPVTAKSLRGTKHNTPGV